jgi:polyisoprenoid-binding protein YceI
MLTLLGHANAQEFIATDGYVEFTSQAPLHEFKGKSSNLNGLIDLKENLLDFYVDLNTLKTGITKRDLDMQKTYLNTEDFPFAEFTGSLNNADKLTLAPNTPQEVSATGIFSIHGVEKEITVKGTLTRLKNGLKLKATWTVLLNDYNIERPGFLFYELSEEQIVNIDLLLKSTN